MIVRDDISDQLIHFTKPVKNDPDNFLSNSLKVFGKIIKEKVLNGGTGYIRGSYRCICFTEAPLTKLPIMFANRKSMGIRYSPYGFMFSKKWLHSKGARPVIYGDDSDFEKLPEELRYRHVKLFFGNKYSTDYTWEREWRLLNDSLEFSPADVTLVVPHRKVADALRKRFISELWHIVSLSDLGISLEPIEEN
jgi:hypothetical protein